MLPDQTLRLATQTDVPALQTQLAALDNFRGRRYREVEHEEQGWKNLTLNVLTHGFGEGSNNVRQFHQARWAGEHHVNMDEGEIEQNFHQRIEAFAAMLKSSLAELEMMGAVAAAEPTAREGVVAVKAESRDVFLVHGHDNAVKESVARFLEKLDLRPIILHEQPNKGRTIIEKFEAHSDVGFAVVLLTPDDVGAVKAEADRVNPRARQNVILELGYFTGKLGRARVCALYTGEVEIPSDIHGVIYIRFDEGEHGVGNLQQRSKRRVSPWT